MSLQSDKPHTSEAQQQEELTPVTSLVEDASPRSVPRRSLKDTVIEKMKSILEELADDISVSGNGITRGDLDLIASHFDKDTAQAASEIVEMITADVEPEPFETSDTPLPSESTYIWTMVFSRIKAFHIKRFAMTAILNFVGKILRKFLGILPEIDKRWMELLIDGVEDMIPLIEHRRACTNVTCMYRRMASYITNGEYEFIKKNLDEFIFNKLNPQKKQRIHIMCFIRTQTDSFMKHWSKWLNQQAEQREMIGQLTTAQRNTVRVVESILGSRASSPEEEKPTTPLLAAAPASVTDEPAVGEEAEETAQPASSASCANVAKTHHGWVGGWDKRGFSQQTLSLCMLASARTKPLL